VIGSAVNPVLRQGNNIRMIPTPIKESAKKISRFNGFTIKRMGKWLQEPCVPHGKGDFLK